MFKYQVILVSAIAVSLSLEDKCVDRQVFDENGLNLNKHCCNDSNGKTWFANVEKNHQLCCDGASKPVYDHRLFMCHQSLVIPKLPYLIQYNPNIVREKEPECASDNPYCCGGFLLDDNYLCAECGTMIRKRKRNHNSICSNRLTYNSNTHICLNGRVKRLPRAIVTGICGSHKLTARDLCCFDTLYRNALALHRSPSCCGAKLVKDDEVCCRSLVYRKKPGYQCFVDGRCAGLYQNRKKCGVNLDPTHLYWYKVTSINSGNQDTFCSNGTLLLQENDIPSSIISNFQLKMSSCKKLKTRKWFVLMTTKPLSTSSGYLDIKSRNVIKAPKSTQRYQNKYLRKLLNS